MHYIADASSIRLHGSQGVTKLSKLTGVSFLSIISESNGYIHLLELLVLR